MGKWQRYGSPKYGLWQSAKVRQVCAKTAAHAGRTWSNSSPLVQALVITVPCAAFKTIFWAKNYEIAKLLCILAKKLFYCKDLLPTLYMPHLYM
jgi:hypothetical protein